MRLPGMNLSTANCYRDKLAMRTTANRMGFLVPEFCGVFNYDALRAYMAHVQPPWLLKPRAEASALGIRKIEEPERLWRTLDELGDEQSRFLLEQFVPGDIFHVDSIVSESKVVFSVAHQYGRPPMQVMHEGGVFTTRTVDRKSEDWHKLTDLNAKLAPALGMVRGVTHAEYIRAHADGRVLLSRDRRPGRWRLHFRSGRDRDRHQSLARVGPARSGRLCAASATSVRRAVGLCGQRSLSREDGGARHLELRRARDRLPHEETSPRGIDRSFAARRPGEGTARAVQCAVRRKVSGQYASAAQADRITTRTLHPG